MRRVGRNLPRPIAFDYTTACTIIQVVAKCYSQVSEIIFTRKIKTFTENKPVGHLLRRRHEADVYQEHCRSYQPRLGTQYLSTETTRHSGVCKQPIISSIQCLSG